MGGAACGREPGAKAAVSKRRWLGTLLPAARRPFARPLTDTRLLSYRLCTYTCCCKGKGSCCEGVATARCRQLPDSGGVALGTHLDSHRGSLRGFRRIGRHAEWSALGHVCTRHAPASCPSGALGSTEMADAGFGVVMAYGKANELPSRRRTSGVRQTAPVSTV